LALENDLSKLEDLRPVAGSFRHPEGVKCPWGTKLRNDGRWLCRAQMVSSGLVNRGPLPSDRITYTREHGVPEGPFNTPEAAQEATTA